MRALLVLLGAALLTTCSTDSPLAPGVPMRAPLNLSSLLRAGGEIPINVDTVVVELRRYSDSALVFSHDYPSSQFQQGKDSLAIEIDVQLTSPTEQFYLYCAAKGGGVVYYIVQSVVTATAGGRTTTPPLTPTYVGPGANADSVVLQLAASTVAAGDSVLATATTYAAASVVTGAPVGILSSDSTKVVASPLGLSRAWLHALPATSGSVTITAITPINLTRTASLTIASAAQSLVKVSGDSQQFNTGQTSQPLVVQVRDAQGQPFRLGYPVQFSLGSPPSGTTLSATSVTTDTGGYARTTIVAGANAGTAQVSASASGLSGSPVLFFFTLTRATTGPGSVTANSTVSQSQTVNQLVTAPPSVVVKDSGGQLLSGVTVSFGVTSGGGTITGGTQVTNSSGVATASSWRLGTAAGANTVNAVVAGLPAVTFSATGTPTAVLTIVKDSGDAQTDSSGKTLPARLVAEVHDSFGNPVPGIPATWSVTDGTITPTTDTSDALGRARASWTLGTAQANPTATVVAAGKQTTFSATTLFAAPVIQLSFAGLPGVGIGLTARVYVTLNQPAPSGGVTVTLTSGNTSYYTVAPGSVTIAQGKTQDSVTVSGVGAGQANLTATATGYTMGSLTVVVQNRNISVPPTLSVPYGQTASLPIQLPAPALAGGVTFTVASSDTTKVKVTTPSVTIAAGGQTANATLSGVLPGPATITVTNAAYVTGTTAATTAAALKYSSSSATLNASFPTAVTVSFQSNGVATAAPAPGIPVTFTSLVPGCVQAKVSPATIPTGQVSVIDTLIFGNNSTLPCTAKVAASSPNLQPDTVSVTVNPVPPITLSLGYPSLGERLQDLLSVYLGSAAPTIDTVTIISSDTTKLRISSSATARGSASLKVPVPIGQTSFSVYLQSIDTIPGAVLLTASAPGFVTDTITETIVRSGIEIQGLSASQTTLGGNSNFYAQVGVPQGQLTSLVRAQSVTPGLASPMVATFTSSSSLGLIVDSVTPAGAATGHATVPPAYYYTSTSGPTYGGVAFAPRLAGTDTVTVSMPSVTTMSVNGVRSVAVTQPVITMSAGYPSVGSGLQDAMSVFLSASQHNGARINVVSRDSTRFLLSLDPTALGTGTLSDSLLNGQTSFSFYVQALDTASAGASAYIYVSEAASRFVPDSLSELVAQPGVEVQGVPTTWTTLSGTFNYYAQVGVPSGQLTGLVRAQNRRGGASPLTVSFTSSNLAIGGVLDSLNPATPGSQRSAHIGPNIYYTSTSGPTYGGVAFQPAGTGTDTLSATIPGFLTMSVNGFRPVAVSQPYITVSNSYSEVGGGLQSSGGIYLSAGNTGGASVKVTVSDSSLMLIDTMANGLGHGSITKTLLNGQTSFGYYYQGLEGKTGAVTIIATEPRFTTGTAVDTVVIPGVEVQGLPGSTTTLSPNSPFYAQVGVLNSVGTGLVQVQGVRGGAAGPLAVTFYSSPAFNDLVDSLHVGNPGPTGTAHIPVGTYYTYTNGAAGGGIEFHPVVNGNMTITDSISGFTTASTNGSRVIAVSQPGITLSVNYPQVGGGLQMSGNGYLGASNHGGVTVTISSSDTTVLKLSPDATTPGTGSIQLPVANGSTAFSYYVQGLEGVTGTVTITATASGFTNGTTSEQVVQPGVEIQGLGLTQTHGAADNSFYAQVGVPNATNTGLVSAQSVRAGAAAPLTITFTTSDQTVGPLVNSAGALGTTQTAQIPTNFYYTPTSVSSGGVAFRPLTPGVTTVQVTTPGYVQMTTNGVRIVTVQ
ncbi:MAG TPA: Ig-like domain-containing protein [Gemmatimonadales bacterium]|nr:Ig-like domain-containing protein [Gemmatimonadales bacterium]